MFACLLGLAACASPETWEAECREKYASEAAVARCVGNARAEYSQRMNNISQSLKSMTLSGQQQSSQTYSPRLGGSSALTVASTELCPLRYGSGTLNGSTISGLNRICYYR
mgnify:CR=1 FL=1